MEHSVGATESGPMAKPGRESQHGGAAFGKREPSLIHFASKGD